MKWWNKEDKGQPIAVATPVLPGAVHMPGPGGKDPELAMALRASLEEANASPQKPVPSAPSSGSYVPPNGHCATSANAGQTMPHSPSTHLFSRQEGPQTIGPMEREIYKIQTMGNRAPLHKFFVVYSIIAGLTGINNLLAQLIALSIPGNYQIDVMLRLYMIAFFAVVLLNELEVNQPLRESFVLSNWISRGVIYSFLGLLGQHLFDVGQDNRYRRNFNYRCNSSGSSCYYGPRLPTGEDLAEWYVWLTSNLMFCVGIGYVIMGALCLQKKLARLREEYQRSQTPVSTNCQRCGK